MARSFALAAAIGLFCAQAALADIYIIANPQVPIGMLTAEEVKSIFIGQRIKWNNSLEIHLTLVKGSGPYAEFTKKILKKTTTQYDNWWKKMIFTGQGKMPKVFNNEKDALQYVAETPGAIGYIATEPKVDTIKVLVIKN